MPETVYSLSLSLTLTSYADKKKMKNVKKKMAKKEDRRKKKGVEERTKDYLRFLLP